jgi:NADH-quinone oxidoreductase subunit N
MTFAMADLVPALAETFLLAMTSVVLVLDLVFGTRNRNVTYILAQLTLLGAALATVAVAGSHPTYTFSGMFVNDTMGNALKLAGLGAVSLLMVYSRQYLVLRGMFNGEFFVLALFAMLGMMVMISASHFLTLYRAWSCSRSASTPWWPCSAIPRSPPRPR